MTVAVVILNWNGEQLLEKFLPTAEEFSKNATIYVADNASTDGSVSFIKTNYPNIKIIQNTQNFGFAQGYNLALKNINADIFALVNSDIEVTKNWLNPIIDVFKIQKNTAIVQPKILDYKNKNYFEYAGAAGGFIDKYGYPFCRGRIFDTIEKDENQYQSDKIFWASGACFFIRKSVFEELNGFDDDFFAHQEEIDLCWRAFNKNFEVTYCDSSTVYHLGGATLQTGSSKKTYLNFRNSLFMLTKNLPKNKLIPIIFTRMILDGLAGIQFLLKGKVLHFFAILKAHFSFYNNAQKFYKKRDDYQKSNYFYSNNIVNQYFLKKIKTFKKLN
jgi:GT2 family glycosyltransferase